MISAGSIRLALLAAAVAVSALTCLVAFLAGSALLALLGASAALLTGGALGLELRGEPADRQSLVETAVAHAKAGRKLVIYERETGAFAHWYVELRCDEECGRTKRYDRSLTLLLIEPAAGTEPWEVQEKVGAWLKEELRATDLIGYSGNARFVVVMPETAIEGARVVASRLRLSVEGTDVGLASAPADGANFDELSAVARIDLQANAERAA